MGIRSRSVAGAPRRRATTIPTGEETTLEATARIVREHCPDCRIIIFGPATCGYIRDGHVDLVVVVKEGYTREDIWALDRKLVEALVREWIDPNLTVVTRRQFKEHADDGYSDIYEAAHHGKELRDHGHVQAVHTLRAQATRCQRAQRIRIVRGDVLPCPSVRGEGP